MQSSVFALMSVCLKNVKSITVPRLKNGLATAAFATLLGTTTTTLVSFGFSAKSTTAQTIYQFNESYELEQITTPIPGSDVFKVLVSGYNPNAQYGLTNYTIESYVQADLDAGRFTFNTDPTQLGLEGFPTGSVIYSGSNGDRVFGSSSGTSTLDLTSGTLTGTPTDTIAGGTGRFIGATGTINVFGSVTISEDLTATLRGQSFASGSFQTPQSVPEPSLLLGLLTFGACSGNAWLKRKRK